jgi:hypothetical protein
MKIKGNPINFSSYWRVFAIALTAVMIFTSAAQIIFNPVEPVYDQHALIKYSTIQNWYFLHWERYLSCVYLLNIYNFLAPHEPIGYNTGLRIIAMALYLISGTVLFWSMTGAANIVLYIIVMTLLYTSRFIFLWNSAELFAGAFLMLILWSLVQRMSFSVTAIFIILFSFAKTGLIFCGSIVGIFLALAQSSSWRGRIVNLCISIVVFILFLVPVFLQGGISGILPGGYAMYAFGQHYAVEIAHHQVTPIQKDPWLEYEKFFIPIWGENKSILKAIAGHPRLYLDFIFLSLGHTIINFCRSYLILLVPIAVYCLRITKQRMLKITSLLFLLNFIPITLVAYMHVRYAAQFYPLLLFMILLGVSDLHQKSKTSRVIISYLIFVALFQVYQFKTVFLAGHWFCD